MMKEKGQIWIETVVYTLIGLALIGLVLAIATPKINQAKDRIIVEQTINSLSVFDDKIIETLDWGPGNIRIAEITMRRGELYINASSDEILILLGDLSKPYSEPGIPIENGRVTIVSSEGQKSSSVRLSLDYTGIFNLTYRGSEELKKFNAANTPYKFSIKNLGDLNPDDDDMLFVLDIVEGSE